MENGVMSHLRMNLNNPILDEEKRGDELAQLVEYFCKNRGRHKLYGHQYIYVTIFNAVHVFLDVVITHFVLNRYFCVFTEKISHNFFFMDLIFSDHFYPMVGIMNMEATQEFFAIKTSYFRKPPNVTCTCMGLLEPECSMTDFASYPSTC